MSVLLTVILCLITAAAGVFLWAYVAGNAWWASRLGRALVGQGTGLLLILGYASLKRLFSWPTIPWVQIALYLIVLAIEVGMAITFVRERRLIWRTRQARKDHRRLWGKHRSETKS